VDVSQNSPRKNDGVGSKSPDKKKQKKLRGRSVKEEEDDPSNDRDGLVKLLRKCENELAEMRQRHRDDTESNKSILAELRLRYMDVLNTNKFLLAQLAGQNIPSADGDAAAFHSLVNTCADNLTEMAQKEREKENTTLFGPEQLNCSFSGFVNDRIGPVVNLLKRIMEQATSKLGINAVTDDVDNIPKHPWHSPCSQRWHERSIP